MHQESQYCKKEADSRPCQSVISPDSSLSKRSNNILNYSLSRSFESTIRVDDRSNSASFIKKQPHPHAMHAISLHSGQQPHLPQWPPPDHPPLTPMNVGYSRYFFGATIGINNTSPTWTLHRGIGNLQPRNVNQVIYVNTDIPELNPETVINQTAVCSVPMIWITASDGTEEITTEEIEILPIPETGSWSKVETNDSVDNQTIVHNPFAIQSPASESPYNHHLAFQRLVIHQAIISQHPSEEIIYGLEEEEDNTEFVLVTGSNLDSHVTLPMSDDMILVGQRVFNNYDAEMSMTSDNPN